MPVQVKQNIPPVGFARLGPGEFLAYALEPEPGRPAMFDFVCRRRKIVPPTVDRRPIIRWYLGAQPPPEFPDSNVHFPLDMQQGQFDVYTVGLTFAQSQGYRLRIAYYPGNVPVQDTTFVAQSALDHIPDSLSVEVG